MKTVGYLVLPNNFTTTLIPAPVLAPVALTPCPSPLSISVSTSQSDPPTYFDRGFFSPFGYSISL